MKQKSVADQWAESIFKADDFQARWRKHKAMFGANIDALFADDYKSKVHIAAILSEMENGMYDVALGKLKGYLKDCSPNDEGILLRLVDICQNQIEPKVYPQMSAMYAMYRDRLLSNGFLEATKKPGRFCRKATEKTTFVVNLTDEDGCITVLYGFASTASDEAWIAENGVDEDNCQIRNLLVISTDTDEVSASRMISEFYQEYQNVEKEELLSRKKQRQTAFLENFTLALKPLGFRKRGAKWTRKLEQGYEVVFYAQKSDYSDQYYFNLDIKHAPDQTFGHCFETRVVMYGKDLYNWQLMSQKQINHLVDYTVENMILPILQTPLEILGKEAYICKGCLCRRNKCAKCWVARNHWGK